MILTVTPNPCVDKTVFIDELKVGTFMRAPRYTCIAGGKGTNVARAACAMGADATAFVVVGGHTGRHVVEMIEGDGIPCAPVYVDSPTRTITTVLEESVHRQTAFFEPGSRISPDDLACIVAAFREAVHGARVVAFCGTVSDPAARDLYTRLIPLAREAGARVLLDSHGQEFALALEEKPDVVKPNVAEAEELFGMSLADDPAKGEAVAKFHTMGVGTVVLSLGKDGALVSDGAERLHAIPPAIEEVNPVGSGDALLAGFAMGFVNGESLETMARRGIAMGTANAMSWDIGHFSKGDVDGLLERVTIRQLD